MTKNLTVSNMLNALIPISRFSKGEANKVFEEVKESGCKIVVKNNTPVCVLLTPEKYQEIMGMLDDQYLIVLTQERLKHTNGKTIPAGQVYAELGMSDEGLEQLPDPVLGVDFE